MLERFVCENVFLHEIVNMVLKTASKLSIIFCLCACAAPEPIQPKYISEAPLPKGWSEPANYNQVTEKAFPAYRAAYTNSKGQNFAFFRLFKHIKQKNIPMTSPVEMDMEVNGEKIAMTSMGFLYQNSDVGTVGPNGEKVIVKDMPAMNVLSYVWQGGRSSAELKKAKEAIDSELNKKGFKTDDYRVMGYNGPSVPRKLKTWEMIAVLPKK